MIDIPDFVYPKDLNGNELCPKCRKLVSLCDCPFVGPAKLKPQSIKPSIRLDRSGRKGKVVTLIGNLPHNEVYLRDLAKTLKVKTGSGGTFYFAENSGTVELQGDHKEIVIKFFKEKIQKEK
jgi:translation initiation factor 1 (eIF-1/SUI1)